MENAPQIGESQGCLGAGNFIVYADFNCPFCYALNERLHAMGLGERVDFRSVQHLSSATSDNAGLKALIDLTREVADVRRTQSPVNRDCGTVVPTQLGASVCAPRPGVEKISR
jgi:hypothetical protein